MTLVIVLMLVTTPPSGVVVNHTTDGCAVEGEDKGSAEEMACDRF